MVFSFQLMNAWIFILLQEHPYAKKYKVEGEKLWCELSLIFGGNCYSEVDKIKQFIGISRNSHETIVISDSVEDVLSDGVYDQRSVLGKKSDK